MVPPGILSEERLAAIRDAVPEAFGDGRLNWGNLREILGEYSDPNEDEHFGLSWPGKHEARRIAGTPSHGTLVPAAAEGINAGDSDNVVIAGENLEVLKLLQKSYANRVKLIYIDPPYNTGNDFVYRDDFREPIDTYLRRTGQLDAEGTPQTTNTKADGRFHSNWLSMMYPRLRLARGLLRDDGAIFVSIDDTEVANLRLIMDEVFGPENFLATIIWQKVFSPKNTARYFSEDHDYVLVYARRADAWTPNLLPRSEEANSRYTNPDNDRRGVWTSGDLSARNYYGEGTYSVRTPSGRVIDGPPTGRYWTIAKAKFEALDRDHRIWWGPEGNNMPRLKRFLSEVKQGIVPQTLWKHEDVGNTQEAKKELLARVSFESSDSVFDTPKPVRLIERILRIATEAQSGDIVMDFFAGSGTTGEAVLSLNAKDGGNRKFLLVQLPEETGFTDYPTIVELTKTRIKSACEDHGAGFRVYTLDRSNFRAWDDYDGTDLEELQSLFAEAETPLAKGWTHEGLLHEVMLLEGFPLDSMVSPRTMDRGRAFLVTSPDVPHRLLCCFEQKVNESAILRLALHDTDVIVCLDSALSDRAKMRLADRHTLRTI